MTREEIEARLVELSAAIDDVAELIDFDHDWQGRRSETDATS